MLAAIPKIAFSQFTAIGQSFTGSTFGIDSSFRMPDTMGAAGIDHYVELINGRFSIYRKSNAVRVHTRTLNQFWNDAGVLPFGIDGAFDPRVVYDPHARRWYAVAVDDRTNANSILFAVSNSSDPTQTWTGFKIDSDGDDSNWADFPMLGYNPEGVYISANMPPLTAPQTRLTFVTIPKADLLQPVPSIANMALLQDVQRPAFTNALSPQLAVDASNAIGLNTTLPLLMHDFNAGTIYRAEMQPTGSPGVTNIGPVALAAAANPPTVDQPGPKQNLEANDGRFSANTVLHNGEIYAAHSIDNGGLASVRFLRLDAATNAVLESQTIVDPLGRALSFPSIAVNDFGDVVIGVTGTSTTEFASSYAVVGKMGGGITTFNPPMLLQAGVSDYERLDALNRNRWGDYSATTVDPADPGIFWTSQEFVGTTDTWSTRVTELVVLQPNEARWVLPSGGNVDDPTQWQTAHGAAPLPSEHIVFSRPADPSGVSTTVVFSPQPPGVYSYQSLSTRQGDVLLDLAGNQLDLALHVEVGPYYANPRLTINDGTVTSVAGFVAVRPTSAGELVLNNTHWSVDTVIVGSAPTPSACCGLPGASGGMGTLTIDNGSVVAVAGTLTIWNASAVNLVDGVLTADTIQQFAPPLPGGLGFGLNFTGGILQVNRFGGLLINSGGTLAPGGLAAVGTTDVNFQYDQLTVAGGTLAIDIDGPNPGDYDRIVVGGDAMLGALDISYLGGYMPAIGHVFEIVNAGAIPPAGVANLLANTTFPSTGSNWLGWHVFSGLNPSGMSALFLAIVPALTGDFNANGIVDAADYVVWRNQNGQSGFGLAADSNHDGVVNLIDYQAWRANFGQSIPGLGSGVGIVPESTSAVLMILAAFFLGPPVARCTRNTKPAW
jgi:hypothetical protein